jgi:hypothetical protein
MPVARNWHGEPRNENGRHQPGGQNQRHQRNKMGLQIRSDLCIPARSAPGAYIIPLIDDIGKCLANYGMGGHQELGCHFRRKALENLFGYSGHSRCVQEHIGIACIGHWAGAFLRRDALAQAAQTASFFEPDGTQIIVGLA